MHEAMVLLGKDLWNEETGHAFQLLLKELELEPEPNSTMGLPETSSKMFIMATSICSWKSGFVGNPQVTPFKMVLELVRKRPLTLRFVEATAEHREGYGDRRPQISPSQHNFRIRQSMEEEISGSSRKLLLIADQVPIL